jgi:hypothetical protein
MIFVLDTIPDCVWKTARWYFYPKDWTIWDHWLIHMHDIVQLIKGIENHWNASIDCKKYYICCLRRIFQIFHANMIITSASDGLSRSWELSSNYDSLWKCTARRMHDCLGSTRSHWERRPFGGKEGQISRSILMAINDMTDNEMQLSRISRKSNRPQCISQIIKIKVSVCTTFNLDLNIVTDWAKRNAFSFLRMTIKYLGNIPAFGILRIDTIDSYKSRYNAIMEFLI